MTAGSIKAPTIIPLRMPEPGKPKSLIDIFTRIELSCDTPNVDIYFSINGAKPEPELSSRDRSTFYYKKPFTLPVGRRTVKAVSVSKDASRQSSVVTKVFEVKWVESETGEQVDDTYGFLGDRPVSPKSETRHKQLPTKYSEAERMQEKGTFRFKLATSPHATSSNMRVSFSEKNLAGKMGSGDSADEKKAKKTSDGPTSRPPPHQQLRITNGSSQQLENVTQVMRLQKSTDFLKCVHCLAPRPVDPFTRYCTNCGEAIPPLPQTRLPPPESGQLGMCVHCRSMVPMHLPTCVVCEMPIQPQYQPQSSVRLQERLLCHSCGTANPPQMTNCLTCEARLSTADPKRQIQMAVLPTASSPPSSRAFPPGPSLTMSTRQCNSCTRANSVDSRFCDWCGAKLSLDDSLGRGQWNSTFSSHGVSGPGNLLACTSCSAMNEMQSRHCAQCGVVLRPPTQNYQQGDTNSWRSLSLGSPQPAMMSGGPGGGGYSQGMGASYMSSASQQGGDQDRLYFTHRRPTHSDAACQTVGIFFPSSTKMRHLETEEEMRARLEKEIKNRAPLITAISPGKGYWRKQLDHVVAHLKSYTNNNLEFRSLLGEPRMGKLLSAQIRDDGFEVNISLTFTQKSSAEAVDLEYLDMESHVTRAPPSGRPQSGTGRHPPPYGFIGVRTSNGGPGSVTSSTARRGHRTNSFTGDFSYRHYAGSLDSFRSDGEESFVSASGRRKRTKRRSSRSTSSRRSGVAYVSLTEQEKALFKEVGKGGASRPSEIQQLVDEGANPNVRNADGETPVIVAVLHHNKDAIPALVQTGTDIHAKFGPKGNTALHEAVLLGPAWLDVVDTLLGCGANPQLKNERNESAFDVAVKCNWEAVISRMAAKMGQTKLHEIVNSNMNSNTNNNTVTTQPGDSATATPRATPT